MIIVMGVVALGLGFVSGYWIGHHDANENWRRAMKTTADGYKAWADKHAENLRRLNNEKPKW